MADLKTEGVVLPDSELGWFLKEKLGLDPLRKQLLETALVGKEGYAVIEAEALRLFKDLRSSDPLFRKPAVPAASRFFQRRSPASTPSATSTTMSRLWASSMARSRTTSSASSGPRLLGRGFPPRQAHVAEQQEDPEDGEMEEDADEVQDADTMDSPPTLEELLQTEAEVLAAELEQAAEEGADDALVSMREAQTRLQAVRRDRGYKTQAPTSSAKGKSKGRGLGTIALRKQSGKHPCFDCGEHGHWAGDAACKQPGRAWPERRTQPGRSEWLSTRHKSWNLTSAAWLARRNPTTPSWLCTRTWAKRCSKMR